MVFFAAIRANGDDPAPLAVLPEDDTGLAAKYPADKGIDADPAVIFHDDFEGNDLHKKWENTFHNERIRIASEPGNVHAGTHALEFTSPKQAEELSNGVVKLFKTGQDVVFLRYYSKFDEGFDQTGSSHNGSCLSALAPGMPDATPGIKADGKNKFVACLEDWRGDAKTQSPGELNVYLYHPEQRTEYGDHLFPSGTVLPWTYKKGDYGPHFTSRPDIMPKLGRWYCYELMLKANTPGKRDGRIACWLDGKLFADFPNLRLRDVESLKINSACLGLHIKSNTTRENKKWYDDVVIATSYVGPMKQ